MERWSYDPQRLEMDSDQRRSQRRGAPPGPRPEVWAGRLQRGEPDAVREVRLRVARILSHRGLRIPRQEQDDLEQEIMIQVWQGVNRPAFDRTAGFWGFVETVTARRCIDWLRAHEERPPLPDDPPASGEGPLRQTLDRERSASAAQILAALGPACRRLITLRMSEGLSYREIARALGKTEGALRVQLYRCIERARRVSEGIGRREGPEVGGRGTP